MRFYKKKKLVSIFTDGLACNNFPITFLDSIRYFRYIQALFPLRSMQKSRYLAIMTECA